MSSRFLPPVCVRNLISQNLKNYMLSSLAYRFAHQLVQVTDTCKYPPIVDRSEEGLKRHNRQVLYDAIRNMNTVEEKQFELTIRQKLKLPKYILTPVPSTYSGGFFHRYITRTHVITELPDKFSKMQVEKELSEVKDVFIETLNNFYCDPWLKNSMTALPKRLLEQNAGGDLVKNLIGHCFKKLAIRNNYINNSTIHTKPHINSYWWHSGFESKENDLHEKNLCFFFEDRPSFCIRSKHNLSSVVPWDNELCATADVPNYNYHPDGLSIVNDGRWLSSLPGFWPGDPHEFPLLIVKTSDELQPLLHRIEKCDISEIENSVGVLSCFGCLNACATYQGFTPFHDITYPFVTQMILTNGQDWYFFVYQMNTIAFHEDVDLRQRRNICWTSGKMRLFETIEDGQVKGVNDDVFRNLIRLLLHAPEKPELEDESVLKPYLGPDTRTDEEREHMRYLHRRMMCNVPEYDAHKEEIPTWQQIYKFHPDAPPSPYIKMA